MIILSVVTYAQPYRGNLLLSGQQVVVIPVNSWHGECPCDALLSVAKEAPFKSRWYTACIFPISCVQVEPFTVNIRADTCPPDPKDRVQTVIIRPSDFLKDKLNVTVEIICDCDCQIPPDVTPVSNGHLGSQMLVPCHVNWLVGCRLLFKKNLKQS